MVILGITGFNVIRQ